MDFCFLRRDMLIFIDELHIAFQFNVAKLRVSVEFVGVDRDPTDTGLRESRLRPSVFSKNKTKQELKNNDAIHSDIITIVFVRV